jgi:hypothetical protein
VEGSQFMLQKLHVDQDIHLHSIIPRLNKLNIRL